MIKPTSPEEIVDIISKVNTSNENGPNSIPQPLLQSVKKSIAITLSNMFNMSFTAEECPTFLKISSVIPVYKKDSKLMVSIIDQFP